MKLFESKATRDWKAREAEAQRVLQSAEREVKECEATLADAKRRHAASMHAVLGLHHERADAVRAENAKLEEVQRAKRRTEAAVEKLKPLDAEIARLTEERHRHHSAGNGAGVASLDELIGKRKEQRRELANA